MESHLHSLENKLTQLITISAQLRADNHQLRQELAQAHSNHRQLGDKMDSATAHLEKILTSLPADQS
jgi:cell division protein ZapB